MKYQCLYSLLKFERFTPAQKLQALNKLIAALEQTLGEEQERNRLIKHILELQPLLPENIPDKLSLFLAELNPRLSPHQLLNKLYFYHEGALRKDDQLSLKFPLPQGVISPELRQKAAQITLIADNLRSVFNIGSLFRIAECLGIGKLMLCGISPTPDHPHIPKTAMGTQQLVSWKSYPTTLEAITQARSEGYRICALETCAGAIPVFQYQWRDPLALVVGNETLGIDPEVLSNCDESIYLPQLGWKSSLNVGVATSIALYQIIFGVHSG